MDSCDKEFYELLQLIFPEDKYRVVYETLYLFEWNKTRHHDESFREHCVLTGRFMEEFCQEKNLLQGTWNGITYARLVGFLHDVGKPFAMRRKGLYQFFTGHAQVGARLCYLRFQHEIPEPILLKMTTAIDSHMCSLRNDKIDKERKLRINAVMHLYFPSLDMVPILECLHRADARGKTPSITDECAAYLPESPFPYRKKDRIVIFLIGPSGSGKTTLAEKLKLQLSAYGSVYHLERDRILMEFALEGESYQTCRQRVYDDPQLKEKFQRLWTRTLYSADSKILLVDTVQNYYHMEAQHFFHDFRIGLYCIPMSFIDDKLLGKNPYIKFPATDWMGYQTVLTEAKEGPWQLEVGTGVWQVVPTLVKRYLDQFNSQISLEEQPTIASLWKKYSGPEAIMAEYNLKGITFTPQYDFGGDKEIIRASYLASFDVTYGPTRYYRGEYLLKTADEISMLRSGFPTFSRNLDVTDGFDKIVITPKYDGSLVNILYIPEQHKHFEHLNKIPGHYYPKYGLLFVGSKQMLMMEKSLREKFDKAIGTSFEEFISLYAHYLKDKITTLHFEMMVMTKSDELTVLYSENFCKFLGYTTFTDTTRSFTLPKKTDFKAIEQYEFTNLLDCEKFMIQQHEKLLEGDLLIEPEGFVLFVYNKNDLKDIIKSKFKEYLAAHKPKYHPELYREIMENPILRTRFQKWQTISEIRDVINPLIQELELELSGNLNSDRKTFALYLKENKEQFEEFQCKMNKITDELRVRSVNLNTIFFQRFPDKDAMMKEIIDSLERLIKGGQKKVLFKKE